MRNARILIIDDEEGIRHTFSTFLSREGYQVTTAPDYPAAMGLISSREFDFILTDILLGTHSGIEILREIKTRGIQAPVIMITGEPNIDNAAASLRYGAFDYITKPIKKETLLRVTKHALQHKALLDEKTFIEKEKERYQSHLEAIFHSVEDGIVSVDNSMNIIEANESFERICGISPKSRQWDKAFTDCTRRCWKVLEEAVAKQRAVKEYRIACDHHRKPQGVVVLNISPLKGKDSATLGAVMVIRDITRLTNLERELQERNQYHNIVGRSPRMQEIYTLLENLREIDTTVLITGASGTGKELVARAVHYGGARAHGPFVVVNCSALAESVLESELFGHVKGAFTGAIHDKEGRFQLADHGTIFLDEIGDISPGIQLKLLRVLENKEIERVGDATPIKLDVQVISATNADLRDKVRKGEFREDLFYRLKVVEVHLPALTDRRDDIPLLVSHFLSLLRKRFHKDISSITPRVEKIFMDFPWPGNVRELFHTLEHAFVVCHKENIDVEDLPPEIRTWAPKDQQTPMAGRTEREEILQALKRSGWNKVKAARTLGISRQTIYRKMREFDINDTGADM
ncbi:MAG TPA: sigma 54-interacting transcriptional regulator [Deltaproteobacteria bacterium]|nr:sigma 54-interacting transcriptional regulator [Deltaproteobacteria bacterium]